MLSCWKLLGVRSSVLEIRSKSGNDVPINLHQTNVTLCSDKKGKGPKAQLSPFRVQAWLREGGPVGGGGQLPCPGVFVQHPVWVLPPVPRPG